MYQFLIYPGGLPGALNPAPGGLGAAPDGGAGGAEPDGGGGGAAPAGACGAGCDGANMLPPGLGGALNALPTPGVPGAFARGVDGAGGACRRGAARGVDGAVLTGAWPSVALATLRLVLRGVSGTGAKSMLEFGGWDAEDEALEEAKRPPTSLSIESTPNASFNNAELNVPEAFGVDGARKPMEALER